MQLIGVSDSSVVYYDDLQLTLITQMMLGVLLA